MDFLSALNPVKAVYHAILSSLLGPFVEDFTKRDFDVSIYSGKLGYLMAVNSARANPAATPSGRARFSNLKLKADALAGLRLPIAVSEGVLESLVLSVPYTREVLFQLLFRSNDVRTIQMEPIELRLRHIRVVVKPLESLDFSPVNAAQASVARSRDGAGVQSAPHSPCRSLPRQ